MGLILDSSILIAAERQGQNARQMLSGIARAVGNTEIAISVLTLTELAHGAARAETPSTKTEANAIHSGIAHGRACSSGFNVDRCPRWKNRW